MAMQILSQLETLFSALSDPTRMRLLNLMREGEVCVCFFTEVLGESQPKISRHLAYLRKSDLVNARRDGKWMHYSIKYPEAGNARKVLESALEQMAEDPELKAENEKLVKVYLSGTAPVTISRAPAPEAIKEVAEQKELEDQPRRERRPAVVEEEIETYLL